MSEFPMPPVVAEAAEAWRAMMGDNSSAGITAELVPLIRANSPATGSDAALVGRPLTSNDHVVPGVEGQPDSMVSVIRRVDSASSPRPGIVQVHGGGMVLGNRWGDIDAVLDWVEHFDAVAVTVEYRLAPEHPAPAAVDDTLAALRWVIERPDELGIDPNRIVMVGWSAGGGIAAGTLLRHRDEGGRPLAGQLLVYPMIDDRNIGVAKEQLANTILWNRQSNDTGWDAYLGASRGGPDVSAYAAPARATDLSGLPPTFIEVGSVDLFRDEDVAYASLLWACGGDCELHVWPGGPHGFQTSAPTSSIARGATATKLAWLTRIFDRES